MLMTWERAFWFGLTLGMTSASLVSLYQFSQDPKNKKGPYFYFGLVHRWVWWWVLALLIILVLWQARAVSSKTVVMVLIGMMTFIAWAFVLSLFRPFLVGLVVWGQQQVNELPDEEEEKP